MNTSTIVLFASGAFPIEHDRHNITTEKKDKIKCYVVLKKECQKLRTELKQ
jgi:hypothetical protein